MLLACSHHSNHPKVITLSLMTESFERLRTSVVSSPITLIADSCRAYSADRNQFPVVAHILFLV
jgi:hypothetical protein